ncbi:splicing factor 3B subunit 2-like protein [Turdus rufiventris]|nr:splicing factor 3B subunit 2-like protein [Turdus rufiventris]
MLPKIPQALEKILQLKESCQEELVTVPGVSAEDEMETQLRLSVSEAEEDTETSEKERNQKRRNRKKKKRGRRGAREVTPTCPRWDPEPLPEVEVEYVSEEPEIYDPNFVLFKSIFEAFRLTGDVNKDKKEPERAESAGAPLK